MASFEHVMARTADSATTFAMARKDHGQEPPPHIHAKPPHLQQCSGWPIWVGHGQDRHFLSSPLPLLAEAPPNKYILPGANLIGGLSE